ncbi:MAG: hypothetical protein ACOVRN_00930 [Flavobacterium sp.]
MSDDKEDEDIFDFNIQHYNLRELESFLTLPPTYTFNDIHQTCGRMNAIIADNKQYDQTYKVRLGRFLEHAKIVLVKHLKEQAEQESKDALNTYDQLLVKTDESHTVNQTSTVYGGHTFTMVPETTSLNDVINPDKRLNAIETYPTNVARSHLNTVKRKTIFQTIVLNTLFREDYFGTSSTDFTIVLPYYFKNVLSLRLSSLQLPNVIYAISRYNSNNTFYIQEDNTDVSGIIQIPDGNYETIQVFADVLQTEINAQLHITPDRFVVYYDVHSGKLTITNTTNPFTMLFSTPTQTVIGTCNKKYEPTDGQRKQSCVDIEQIYKRLGWIMGYRDEVYTGGQSYTTEAVYNGAMTPNYLYFVLNDYNNSQAQNVFGMYSKSIIGDNILGMIPVTSQSHLVNVTNGSDFIERKREYFGPVRIQRLKVELLNQYGDVIDLNNMDYCFSLELEIGYDI